MTDPLSTVDCPHGLDPRWCSLCLHGPPPRAAQEPRISSCRSCGEEIIWGVFPKTRKKMPVNADPCPGRGSITIDGFDADDKPVLVARAKGTGEYVSHFATCRQAKTWRR